MTAAVVTRFRQQLAEAPDPRGVPRRLPAVAMAGFASVLAAVLLLAGGDPRPALAVSREGGWIELELTDPGASPADMTRELQDAGIRGRVVAVPVRADQVGTWVALAEAGRRATCIPPEGAPPREEQVRLGTIEHSRTTVRISAARVRDSTGQFVFVAGRAAGPGEEPLGDDAAAKVVEDVLGAAPRYLPAC